MKKKVIWIVLAVVLVGVLAGAGALYQKLSPEAVPDVPDVTVSQTEETVIEPQPETVSGALPENEEETAPQTDAAETAPQGKKAAAADFTVFDADGSEVSLSSHFGKPLVVNFWTTWCGPCRSELPGFDAAAKAYADKVDFMMVNLAENFNDDVDDAKAFVEENGYTFPVYFDTQGNAADVYGIFSIPVTLFINADGSLMQFYTGAMTEAQLERFLSALTA